MTSDKNQFNLMVTSDTKYVPMVAALIASIHKFLPESMTLEVFWLHVDDSAKARQELTEFCRRSLSRCTLNIVTFDTLPPSIRSQVEELISKNNSSWGPALCFAAPFVLPMILPESIRRAVFVDADVIALRDVSILQTVSLDGLAAGCVKAPLKMFNGRLGLGNYCNSGVIVMDLDVWREQRVSEAAISYLDKISGRWSENFPDQDALNVTLSCPNGQPKWKELDPKWNACSPLYTNPRWRLLYAPVPIKDVGLLHYCGAKPWGRVPATLLGRLARRRGIKFGPTKPAHPHGDLFFEVLASTPFLAPGQ